MPSLIGSVLAAGWLAQQTVAPVAPVAPAQAVAAQPPATQGKPVSANLKIRIATNTYMPDGRVLSASASDWPLRLNEPVVAYAASGKSICEPKAATSQQPELPANGWWVEITPIREGAGELEVRVQWRPLGLVKRATPGRFPLGPTTTLTLHAGDRIVLDYLTGAPSLSVVSGYRVIASDTDPNRFRYFRANTPRQSDGCQAVGMSLEVGLEPAKTDALVEAELWLVRPNRDGTEKSDRQVVRLPVGHLYRYFFDEARLGQAAAGNSAFAKVSGDLSVMAVENGRIRFNFKVARWYGTSPDADTSSTYRDLVAAPGEVLAFQLPAAGAQAQQPLSVRLRANVVR